MRFKFFLIALTVFLISPGAGTMNAQNSPCRFDPATLQFTGTPLEQARCLLRPNGIGGVLGERLRSLPQPFEKLIGLPTKVKPEKLRWFLRASGISETEVGGQLDRPLASAKLHDGRVVEATYFTIHDTSFPYLKDDQFPPNLNADPKWKGNDLSIWLSQPVAHVFVNRLGQSITTTPFEEPVRKGFGTKFARDLLKQEGKGLQIHIEMVQPRRRDPADANPSNDRIAPVPGFTAEQYDRLALLYICASVRRGTWLIPAYHAAIDAGIKDAHDDPQNFALELFGASLIRILRKI